MHIESTLRVHDCLRKVIGTCLMIPIIARCTGDTSTKVDPSRPKNWSRCGHVALLRVLRPGAFLGARYASVASSAQLIGDDGTYKTGKARAKCSV